MIAKCGVEDKIIQEDGFWAFACRLSVGLFKDHAEMLVYSRNGNRDVFERLYSQEQNPRIKKMFGPWISQFFDRRWVNR